MFPDPFLPRIAVTVGKGSGYARLDNESGCDKAAHECEIGGEPDSWNLISGCGTRYM